MEFVSTYGRSYATKAEFEFRSQIFKQKLAEIETHNAKGLSWTLGVNHLTDMTQEETKKLLGFNKNATSPVRNEKYLDISNLADGVDWYTEGAVTPPKNQGQCGSCWAFSTTGAMEGAAWVATHHLYSFSEQQLMEYDTVDAGCNGGLMDNAFNYLKTHKMVTESDCAYKARVPHWPFGRKCTITDAMGVCTVQSYTDVPANSVDQLRAALAKQPVSVAIEADRAAFQGYAGGVLTGTSCGTNLDHGVLAVGYGTTADGIEYFLVKNSWGASWGDHGFIKIGAEAGAGVCGIQQSASYPDTVSC